MDRSFAIAGALGALFAGALLGSAPAFATFVEPQAQALERLRAASTQPLMTRYRDGAPRLLHFDVAAPGATPVASALAFLASWSDLYDQSDPALALVPVATEQAELDVVAFAQRFRGIPIFGAQIVVGVHQPAAGGPRRARFAAGWLLPARTGLDALDTIPAISPGAAETAARVGLGDPVAPVLGETALMIFDPAAFGEPPAPRLVWRVTLMGGVPEQLLVDAHTSAIAFRHALAETGAGLSDYGADFEDANGGTMLGTNCFNPTTIDDDIGSEDGLIEEYLDDPHAAALWWHTRHTYLAYHNQLGRHSWDDDDDEIVVYVHASAGAPNATYAHTCGMEFHDAFVGLDVVAHEFTHAVIRFSLSDLVYQGQSGALNEAFSDSMAALVVDGDDWLIGDDFLDGQGPIRSLEDPTNAQCNSPINPPGACNDPDRFSAFVTTNGDNGGVHTNSGIQNKATYLMAWGGSFNGKTVVGMSRTKTARLVYFLTRFLAPSTATFADARNLAVAIASGWAQDGQHGFTAANLCTVRQAYAAVELGSGDVDCDGDEDDVDDDDQDGVLDVEDNCVGLSNPSQTDQDDDSIGDACDVDNDNDGIPDSVDNCPGLVTDYYGNGDPDDDGLGRDCDPDDDGDGIPDDGAPGDSPCASLDTTNCDDNCIEDPNPTQLDGNGDGFGDACDPDHDGDGFYVDSDNCVFVANEDQADSDEDGIGDACDDCPDVADNANAYTTGFPEFGVDPEPLQPDSDGDGTPDACDTYAFGEAGLAQAAMPWNPTNSLTPNGAREDFDLVGEPGSVVSIPIDVCDPAGDPDGYLAAEYVELAFQGLAESVQASVVDDAGFEVAKSRRARTPIGGAERGMRFKPKCDHRWFLKLELRSDFAGADDFTLIQTVVPGGAGLLDPWSSIDDELVTEPPPRPAPEPAGAAAGAAAVLAVAGRAARMRRRRQAA